NFPKEKLKILIWEEIQRYRNNKTINDLVYINNTKVEHIDHQSDNLVSDGTITSGIIPVNQQQQQPQP
ncbi:unnamed protein product, partial [Schistosoma mattheei]